MKYLTFCCFSLSLLLVSCAKESPSDSTSVEQPVTSEDVKQKVGEAVDTAKEFTKQKRDEYAKQFQQQLEDLNGKITALESRGAKLKDDAKVKWNEQLDELKKQRDQVSKNFEEFQKSSVDAWEGLSKDLDVAWDNLKEAYDETAEEVKENNKD
ncbi:sll1863 family stress response protein [Gimesia panareensis]|uniref:Uncharacterized protein n=1 Tax=Gimesia panareensis TaxID=2527978 RepID=A0A517Q1K7_9PLAN|nr:hypothetical protein [Gimesia panareensis]QDT25521.1 hypothetical protein Enr10x_08170 [Gimesia panareensis]QDU48470.1 hypothetical protein Pan110_07840 [Gimesia panareensis]